MRDAADIAAAGISLAETLDGAVRIAPRPEPDIEPPQEDGPIPLRTLGDPTPWDRPSPLRPRVPPFPVGALPEPVAAFVEALAVATQTPPDLGAMLTLSVMASTVAGGVEVRVREDWTEPLNLYTVVALPPASRKSVVFRFVVQPLEEHERTEQERVRGDVAADRTERAVLEKRVRKLEQVAADGKDDTAMERLKALTRDLAERRDLVEPRWIVGGDVTPEKLSNLLAEQGGRLALMSPEGEAFGLMAGLYSNAPNFEVYLKAHAGDAIRVDRMGRPGEHVERPALTVGLAVQPDVIERLMEQRSFRGRGLLARFLWSVPRSTIGHRDLDPPELPRSVLEGYSRTIRAALRAAPPAGQRRFLRLSVAGRAALLDYQREVEDQLRAGGELGEILDWGGKLVGAVVRIAGVLHSVDSVYGSGGAEINETVVRRATEIGRYLVLHALAAFDLMGSSGSVRIAVKIVSWLREKQPRTVSKRDLFVVFRRSVGDRVEGLDDPLALLIETGHLRPLPNPGEGRPGRNPSSSYEVSPHVLSPRIRTQNPQNGGEP